MLHITLQGLSTILHQDEPSVTLVGYCPLAASMAFHNVIVHIINDTIYMIIDTA